MFYWVVAFVYLLTVITLLIYFTKYYYHRCILITEVHPTRYFPRRCKPFRRLKRRLWFFIIVPFVWKRALRTLKFYFGFKDLKKLDKFLFFTYFLFLFYFVYANVIIHFDIYWEPEWHKVRYYYYLYECDVYFSRIDTPALYYFCRR